MISIWNIAILLQLFSLLCFGQGDPVFRGEWKLNPARSEINGSPGAEALHVEQNAREMKVSSKGSGVSPLVATYPLDGSSAKARSGEAQLNIRTKWEGDALLVSTLVSGPQSYSVSERWSCSRNGATLTIVRTVVRPSGESESTLVYENPSAAAPPVVARAEKPTPRVAAPATAELRVPDAEESAAKPVEPATPHEYVISRGTRVLLRLTNPVNTKHTAVGDPVYLQTAAPVFLEGRLIIPQGSYVMGKVVESARAGKVKGKAALNIRFDSLTLPNGSTRDLSARAGSVEGSGNLDRAEGRIQGDGNKGGDAKTVGKTTAAGAGIGTLAGAAAGNYGLGAGIGAAAGAVAGLAGVLGSRGPDVILHAGTTMEFVLDRDLRFSDAELAAPAR